MVLSTLLAKQRGTVSGGDVTPANFPVDRQRANIRKLGDISKIGVCTSTGDQQVARLWGP
jgi:hypothetical protein